MESLEASVKKSWVGALVLAAAFAAGCGEDDEPKTCNLMAPIDSATLSFTESSDEPGTYALRLETAEQTCVLVTPVPLPSTIADRTGTAPDVLSDLPTCERDGLSASTTSFLELGLDRIEGVRVSRASDLGGFVDDVAWLRYEVYFEDSKLGEGEVTFNYEPDEPNGPGCGYRYTAEASVDLTLDASASGQ